MKYRTELDVAIAAVREASLLCRSVQSKSNTDSFEKDDRSPVTVADFGSQAIICRVIGAAFPDDPVIAEEDATALQDPANRLALERVVAEVSGLRGDVVESDVCTWINRGNANKYSRRFWTLDPIDGTKGFLRDDQYAVALALIVDGELSVAALACPKLDVTFGADMSAGSIYAAVKGEGAWCYEIDGTRSARIHVSETSDPAGARFCESVESAHSSHSDSAELARQLGIVRDPIRLDSQAKYAVVARGDAEIYLRLTKHTGYVEQIWDHAAGALVVEEAGGRVTDLNGRPLDFRHGPRLDQNIGIVATNGLLHDKVLAALSNILISD
jgi:3'(2'), 5'-bisphosphate nucleotidase